MTIPWCFKSNLTTSLIVWFLLCGGYQPCLCSG